MARLAWPRWTLLGVLLLAAAAACSGSSSSQKGFQPLDQAVADVQPSSIGQVIYDQKRGSAKPLTQGPTRYLLVLASGDQAAVESAVGRRLATAGFSELGADAWRRTKGGSTVLIYIKFVESGQDSPSGLRVPSGRTGVWFNVNSGT
jgi:hypothetical protein